MKTATAMTLDVQTAAELMMMNVKSIRAEVGVQEAIAFFTEKGVTAAPVIDEAGHPIGVVSQSDLLIHEREQAKASANKPDYFFAPTFGIEEGEEETSPARTSTETTVADLMTPAIFAVSPDTPVPRVISDMVGLHVHRLFVVDNDGALVGVISTMDVLKHLKAEE
jgi:CBS domain-containing protein